MTNPEIHRSEEASPEHNIVPSSIHGEMTRQFNSSLEAKNLIISPEVSDMLEDVFELYLGQTYAELDRVARAEVNQDVVLRDLNLSADEFERLVQDKIMEKYPAVCATTTNLIAHIATSEGIEVTRTDNQTSPELTISEMGLVTTVLVNITDYVADPDDETMQILALINQEAPLDECSIRYIYGMTAANPNGFQQAIDGALDEIENHGNARAFNRVGVILASMNREQKFDLIEAGLNNLSQSNATETITGIREIGTNLGLPVPRVTRLINDKIESLDPSDPLRADLEGLIMYIEQNVGDIRRHAEERLAQVSEQSDLDVFKIQSLVNSPSKAVGIGMLYWGAATAFANTFLALCQGKPQFFFQNIGTGLVGLGVARSGVSLIGGDGPLDWIGDFTRGLEVSDNNRLALEAGNYAEVVNDTLLSQASSDAIAIFADDRFLQVLNSMSENVPEGQLTRFSTQDFLSRLEATHPDLYAQFETSYVDNFQDSPVELETDLNLLANAFRELSVDSHQSFMENIGLSFGLTDEDIPIID